MNWHRVHRKARKTHSCELCGREILRGETYMAGSGFGNGEAHSWKECLHCESLVQLVLLHEDEYSFDVLGEFEPATFTEARWMVQWRRQWTRRDGQLYPVPS